MAADTLSIGLFVIGIGATAVLHHVYTGKLIDNMNQTTGKLVERINNNTHEMSTVNLAGFFAINKAAREDREISPEDLNEAMVMARKWMSEIEEKNKEN